MTTSKTYFKSYNISKIQELPLAPPPFRPGPTGGLNRASRPLVSFNVAPLTPFLDPPLGISILHRNTYVYIYMVNLFENILKNHKCTILRVLFGATIELWRFT